MDYTACERNCRQYNLAQTAVGSPLKTLRGSTVQRSKYGVGRPFGGSVVLHKSYYAALPKHAIQSYIANKSKVPFEFNCLKYDTVRHELKFVECPDFDTSRESQIGRICSFNFKRDPVVSQPYLQIYHHKWTMVDNNYTGFDVEASWRWSIKWLNVIPVLPQNKNLFSWLDQLVDYGLE